MRVVTWNINSIRVRLERLQAWLTAEKPDVVALQETKVEDEAFPRQEIEALGYHVATFGQRTYNGVAILSRIPLENVHRGMQDGVDDPQARLIAARVGDLDIVNVYVPNGSTVGSEKYTYKLGWLRRLRAFLEQHYRGASDSLVVLGDFNVAPDDKDVAKPAEWAGSVLCHQEARGALQHVMDFGLEDVFRQHHPSGGVYSWWDYRMLAFPKGNGLRIDLVLTSPELTESSTNAWVHREQRKGKQPSDHAPVFVEWTSA